MFTCIPQCGKNYIRLVDLFAYQEEAIDAAIEMKKADGVIEYSP